MTNLPKLAAKWVSPVETEIAPKGERPAYWLRGEFNLPAAPVSAGPSIKVFQAPQAGQRPSHLALLPPQSEQVKMVLSLAMR